MNISIVILNWNRKKDTLGCLESIANLKAGDNKLDIIVVDNASTDGSQRGVGKALQDLGKIKNFSSQLIENKENLGFAAGNNVGMSEAIRWGADYVLILNNDTEVNEDLIVNLLKAAKQNTKAAAISPKIYFAKGYEFHKDRYKKSDLGKVIWYAGGDIDWDNIYGTNHGVDEVDRGQFETLREIDFATGACALLRVKALKETGLFDEKYFMYLEDADLSQRMKKKNWKVLYTPKAFLWHKVAQSSGIGSNLNDYFITRNRLLFGMRYASTRTKFALLRESFKLFLKGRKWQKLGVRDFYLNKFGKGSWK